MSLSNLKIATRLGIALFVVLFFTALITGIGIWRLNDITNSANEMAKASYKQSLAQEWHKAIATNSVRTFAKAKSQNLEDQKALQKEMDSTSEKVGEIQKELEPLLVTAEGKKLFNEIAEKRKKYSEIRSDIFKLKTEKGEAAKDEINALVESKLVPAQNTYIQTVETFVDWQRKLVKDTNEHVIAVSDSSKIIILSCGILAILLGSLYMWNLSRNITKPLTYAVSVAQTIASGDLTSNIEVRSKDETGQLLLALKEMNASLGSIVSQVRQGTDLIATASTEIASGNLDLSSRTEQQAASLEETASSMEELTSTVKQNADNAKQATQLATSATNISIEGGKVVSQVVGTMQEINDSAKKIVDIISVIDNIAFQTNILALNAAVEAARAGEQGRGFAVVASEVRNLAQKSALAAKEIKQLINNSVEKVEVGSDLVEKAGNTMSEVVQSIKRVNDIMAEISAASNEQASGIEQVNKAVVQMDEVTQQNAALVEEASAASQSMQDEAAKLSQVVGIFKVNGVANRVVATSNKKAPVAKKSVVKTVYSNPKNNVSNDGDWEEF
jgi:methyl-accepting chemotaxis protein